MQSYKKYLQKGNKIKIEVEIIPTYLIFEGIISDIQEGYLLVGINGEYIQKDQRRVNCTIIHNDKVCIFSTSLKAFVDGKLILKEPLLEDINILQRRRFTRVDTNISVDCFLVGFKNKTIDSNKRFPTIIKNISGGGLLLNTKLSLPKGTILVFELALDETFLLTMRVLRNEEAGDGSKNLACEFIGITEENRQKIVGYVNRLQLEK